MVKKGRDLFEILGARARAGRSPSTAAKSKQGGASRSARAGEPTSPIEMGRGVVRWVKDRVAGHEMPAAVPRPTVALAGMAFVGLLLGFAIGRLTAGGDAEAASRDLRITPEARPVALSADEESDRLSTSAWELLPYPAPERQKAVRLAAWLRGQGLHRTRLRPVRHRDTGEPWIKVVVYTGEDGLVERALLLRLSDPTFEPRWASVRTKLEQEPAPETYD